MAPINSSPIPLPFVCPICEARKGFPIGLAVQERNTLVAVFRCRDCEFMWQLQREPGEAWPSRFVAAQN